MWPKIGIVQQLLAKASNFEFKNQVLFLRVFALIFFFGQEIVGTWVAQLPKFLSYGLENRGILAQFPAAAKGRKFFPFSRTTRRSLRPTLTPVGTGKSKVADA
jgi:hypothetical protein